MGPNGENQLFHKCGNCGEYDVHTYCIPPTVSSWPATHIVTCVNCNCEDAYDTPDWPGIDQAAKNLMFTKRG